MLTLYARREPTTDPEVQTQWPGMATGRPRFDVVAYSDPDCRTFKARWRWWHSSRPDRRFKRVTLNCYRWRLEWLPDLVEA